jgi:RNA polymerase sigma factor (sigma-70 family)
MSSSSRDHVPASREAAPAGEPAPDVLIGWLEAARRGDAAAARKLLEAVAPAVRNVVRRALGRTHPDGDDMLQESLLGFVRALDSFRGECSVLHYARRIALWRVLEEQKRKQAQKRAPELAAQRDPDRSAVDARAHADTLAARRRGQLRELLASLRPEQAEALAMRHVLDYSVEEIAQATRVPANTVRSRLRLAKEALRTRISDNPALSELDIRQT